MGRHLIELGVTPGPRMGEILKAVYEQQLDGAVTTLEEARSRRARACFRTRNAACPHRPVHLARLVIALTYFANASGCDVAAADNRDDGPLRQSASPRPSITAAVVAAPLGSTTSRACRNNHATARQWPRRCTVTNSSTNCANVREGDVAGTNVHQAVGDLVDDRQRHGLAGRNRGRHLRRALRLDGDDSHRGLRQLDRRGDARGQPAAADRHEHGADVGTLLEDLEAQVPWPDDDLLVIERRHDGQAALARFLLGARLAIEEWCPR